MHNAAIASVAQSVQKNYRKKPSQSNLGKITNSLNLQQTSTGPQKRPLVRKNMSTGGGFSPYKHYTKIESLEEFQDSRRNGEH